MADADKKMKAAFDKYDKDGNGYVTAAEVKAVIEDMLPGIDANVLEKIAKVSTINSLRPSDAIWRQWSWTTLAQVMACCLAAPNHYLNQCWLITTKVYWHSSDGNSTTDTSAISHQNWFENQLFKFHSDLPGTNELRFIIPTHCALRIASAILDQPFSTELREFIKDVHYGINEQSVQIVPGVSKIKFKSTMYPGKYCCNLRLAIF